VSLWFLAALGPSDWEVTTSEQTGWLPPLPPPAELSTCRQERAVDMEDGKGVAMRTAL
jgi:hypothetical protein